MFDHKQAKATHPKTGEVIEVDSRLKKLIAAIWDAGCETYCSCQENDGTGFGYIKLADARDTKRWRRARRNGIQLITELGSLLPVWADISPSDIFLRFNTRDIAKLTRIMTEGV